MKRICLIKTDTLWDDRPRPVKTLGRSSLFSITFFLASNLGSQLLAQTIDEINASLVEKVNSSELTLFENIPNQSPRNIAAQNRSTDLIGSSMPFSLVGVSRIGSNYSVILRNEDNEVVPITAISGAGTPIPDYTQFKIENISSSSVYLSYPDNVMCTSSVNQGVTCNDETNIVRLSLSLRKPIEKKDQPANNRESISDENSNPFEELLRRQEQREAEESLSQDRDSRRFRPRRIPAEEIPEGMRVVSTPFGDRLVEL
jgi:predicted RNA-binding protein with RPS1 domain